MTEINLSSLVYAGMFTVFLFLGIGSFFLEFVINYDIPDAEEVVQDLAYYENTSATYKLKSEGLRDETQNLESDSDAIDVEGNFIVRGWNAVRNAISGTFDIVQANYDLLTRNLEKLGLPPWVTSLSLAALVFALFIVGAKVSISREVK